MSPNMQDGGAGQGPAVNDHAATKQADHGHGTAVLDRLPVVHAVLLMAAPDGVFSRLVVRRCCWCGLPHLHHVPAGSADVQVIRAPRCRPSRRYAVQVVDRLPVALVSLDRAGAA